MPKRPLYLYSIERHTRHRRAGWRLFFGWALLLGLWAGLGVLLAWRG